MHFALPCMDAALNGWGQLAGLCLRAACLLVSRPWRRDRPVVRRPLNLLFF